MKKLFFALSILFVINAQADIEYSAKEDSTATAQEIQKNRACFEDVSAQGCGDPIDDHKHFRACLKDIKPRLNTECQKMMSNLYGV